MVRFIYETFETSDTSETSAFHTSLPAVTIKFQRQFGSQSAFPLCPWVFLLDNSHSLWEPVEIPATLVRTVF